MPPDSVIGSRDASKRSLRVKLQDALASGALVERMVTKARMLISPLRPYRLITMPFARRAMALNEAFHEIILEPNDISRYWADRYLKNLDLPLAFTALEIGCGRGTNLCHLRNAGGTIAGHDIYPHSWWARIGTAHLQVVKPEHRYLPWSVGVFDLVLIMQVAGFFNEMSYRFLAQEIGRVLKPGGYIVMQETNPKSYAIKHHRRYYGREPHSLEMGLSMFATDFERIDHWYEGYYSRHFPMFDNLHRAAKESTPGPWMLNDPRAADIPPEERALWVLRCRKSR